MVDDSQKILALLKTQNDANIELAFQLCVGKNGDYDDKVAKALR